MYEEECEHECRFNRKGKCSLERADLVRPVHGAACMSDVFEKEDAIRC